MTLSIVQLIILCIANIVVGIYISSTMWILMLSNVSENKNKRFIRRIKNERDKS